MRAPSRQNALDIMVSLQRTLHDDRALDVRLLPFGARGLGNPS
jgi:hypothetical protein